MRGKFWDGFSEQSCRCFPGIMHFHLKAACVAFKLEVEAKLRLRPFQAQIRQCQTEVGFGARGKHELPLSPPEHQGMPRPTWDPLPYREEERQTKVDGSHTHGENGIDGSKYDHSRADQMGEWR